MGWFARLSSGRKGLLAALAGVLVLGGIAALVTGLTVQESPPQPRAAARTEGTHAPVTTPPPSSSTQKKTSKPQPLSKNVLDKAIPTHLSIPAIGVSHDVEQLGQNPDGSIQVPGLSHVDVPGWYKYSPAPGQRGPSVLVGHIDSASQGKGVFYNLGALHQGNKLSVARADGKVAVFRIDRMAEYPKSNFPRLKVYGNVPNAQLRLITCGGKFIESKHSYADNIVAYATFIGSHPA